MDPPAGRGQRSTAAANTDCTSSRNTICEDLSSFEVEVRDDDNGAFYGSYEVTFRVRGTPDSKNTNVGFATLLTVRPVIAAKKGNTKISVTPYLAGRDGLGDQKIKSFTFDLNGPRTNTYNTTITPALSTRNTQVSFIEYEVTSNRDKGYKDTTSTFIRCDKSQEVNNNSGCVNVQWTPTLDFAESAYPKVAENIQLGQATTGAGIKDRSPLTRATAEQLDTNRKFACSTARKNALIGASPYTGAQCDEYPFASSTQGGTDDTRIAWVPGEEENGVQGRDLLKYYRDGRIMYGDNFYVRIV